MTATLALMLSMPALKPDVDALTWMAGSWTAEVWGGTWEETWSAPVAGTMTLSARHIREGKVGIVEFGSIGTRRRRADAAHDPRSPGKGSKDT
jgi:hypothetical protein